MKGILDVEDAEARRQDAAPTAIVVSNHGGRQLDGAPSSIAMLPKIADAVGNEIEVMFDGGIRSGQDVIRALALGARAVPDRPRLSSRLGALGDPGVKKAIEMIRKELDITIGPDRRHPIAEIDDHVLAI